MKFSILIPVYNVEMFLFTCLNSILKQTCQDFEVILVNDGSSDNSGIICNSYAEKYSNFVVAHQNNQGLISARRKAMKLAKGRYCIFCDSDDFLEETAIEEFSHIVDENNPDLILYNAYIYDGVNKIPFFDNVFEDRIVNNKESVYDLLLLTYKINAMWLKVCKREILDIERDYTDFYKCNYGEDLPQSIPIINNAQSIYYLNKALYNYRITSGMMKKYNSNYYWSYKKVNQEIAKQLKEIQDCTEKLGIHLLMAAYGATTQLKYATDFNVKELENLAFDLEFRRSYDISIKSHYIGFLNIKQRLMLWLLYHKRFSVIKFLIAVKMYIRTIHR